MMTMIPERTSYGRLIQIFLLIFCVHLFFAGGASAELVWDSAPAWTASGNTSSFAARPGDLNGDGFSDIVLADYYGQLSIFYNNAGQIPVTPSWISTDPVGHFFDVHLTDIDNDGLLDILASKEYDGKLYVFLNRNGSFNPVADWSSNAICSYGGRVVNSYDMDGDGFKEVFLQCGSQGLMLIRNNGGSLEKNASWSSHERYSWWVKYDIADFDGDGRLELAIPNGLEEGGSFQDGLYRTFVYRYDPSTGGLDMIWKSPISGGSAGVVAVTHAFWADYDNDGDLDLITSNGTIFLNQGGVLSDIPVVYYRGNNMAIYGMAIGDYNNDGRVDVILTTHCQQCMNRILYFENSADGLVLKQTVAAPGVIVLAENMDFDKDGDEDILLTYLGPGPRIYSNHFVEQNNHPPVASAGPDQTVECAAPSGTTVSLDGSGSVDSDHNALTYAWKEGTSVIATGEKPAVSFSLGTHTIVLTVDDGKGGTAQDTVVVVVRDSLPPVTTLRSVAAVAGNNGWYRSDVTVTVDALDVCSGVREIQYGIDGKLTAVTGDTASFTISGDGIHAVTYSAVDNAGNSETVRPLGVNIDATPPSISVLSAPAPNAGGWNNTNVAVTSICGDSTSGVASCPEPVTVTTEGAGQVFTRTAVDNAGNSASASVTLNIDKTPPVVSALQAGPLMLWPPNHRMVSVLVNGAASDLYSQVVSASYTVIDEYGLIQPHAIGLSAVLPLEAWREGNDIDGRQYTVTLTVADAAGNETSALVPVIVPHDHGN